MARRPGFGMRAGSSTKNKTAHGANCVKGIPDCFCQVGNAAS
jgi:hypothetical protein